jgi:hypothetical protein
MYDPDHSKGSVFGSFSCMTMSSISCKLGKENEKKSDLNLTMTSVCRPSNMIFLALLARFVAVSRFKGPQNNKPSENETRGHQQPTAYRFLYT